MNAPVPMPDADTGGAPLWLVTFADLTAILVALFVLIFSMSTPLSQNGRGLAAGGAAAADIVATEQSADHSSGRPALVADLTIGYLSAVLSDRGLAPLGSSGPVYQTVEGDRLVIRFAPAFAFAPDGRTLRPLAGGLVSDLAAVFSNVANPVSVVAPVSRRDWVLAFDRVDSVVQAFRKSGYEAPVERFVAPGVPGDALMVIIDRTARGAS